MHDIKQCGSECTYARKIKFADFFVLILGFGGLQPPEPLINPRRGSATGSYGLPVPPEWLRSQAEMRRGSK